MTISCIELTNLQKRVYYSHQGIDIKSISPEKTVTASEFNNSLIHIVFQSKVTRSYVYFLTRNSY